MNPEIIDLLEWDQFTEIWNTDVARVIERIESAEICLQAVQDSEPSAQLTNDIKSSKARLE
jgi:hypothetical protein